MPSTENGQAEKGRRATREFNFQEKLEKKLQRLEKKIGFGFGLKVHWLPSASETLSGEVKGTTIYIYEEDETEAMKTLKHEFIDYAISQTIAPYKEVTNKLISLINEDAYKRKERLVEALNKIL